MKTIYRFRLPSAPATTELSELLEILTYVEQQAKLKYNGAKTIINVETSNNSTELTVSI